MYNVEKESEMKNIAPNAEASPKGPRILLRSSWQVVNIGDIAHTPGVLALLEEHFPEAEVTLWASDDLSSEVEAMEHRRFPSLRIVKGRIGRDGKAQNQALAQAMEECDFLLHGSGPFLVGNRDVQAFIKHTGKPFGVFGITYEGNPAEIETMNQAEFLFFRDSVSLQKAKDMGVCCPCMEFGPDGAFSTDLKEEARAVEFLQAKGLEEGRFLCCIPKLRYTPYWLIKKEVAFNEERNARNEEMKEHDHKPLRDAITAVVRNTGLKVLLCPEDMTQVAVGKEMIYDRLPEDVQKQVVWRESFWLTDEALSVYRRSAGLFGNEMHSPIMCIGHGIPAIVCRWAEQTCKGFMWKDIGLGDWLFDLDTPQDVERIVPTVLQLVLDPEGAKAKVDKALAFVRERQLYMVETLKQAVYER